jgi:S-adenosylmethionine:tRNA ribosyltransferase-isomerase
VLNVDDFDFPLPQPEKIAQYPLKNRSESRLLCYSREKPCLIEHHQFHEIIHLLSEGDLLVFNNTKVIPARLFGHKSTGGQVEILLERIINPKQFVAHVRASKALKSGALVYLDTTTDLHEHKYPVEMISRQDDLFLFQLPENLTNIYDYLTHCGHIPLPPYIQRGDVLSDHTRYQTVFAEEPGAVAAPTAGLHFDVELMDRLVEKGIQKGFLTLHVGAGTFQPVRVSSIAEHKMHEEYLDVDQALCDLIEQTKKAGRRVIAVGTTVVRALETAARDGQLKPYSGETDIFITPGFSFKVIDGMITNFHWPRSTLLMLVSAFIGRDKLLALYQEAIEKGYRFFSYGDTMLLL